LWLRNRPQSQEDNKRAGPSGANLRTFRSFPPSIIALGPPAFAAADTEFARFFA
jgi:hypothetical protein